MAISKIYFAGQPDQVAHHATPLMDRFDVEIETPQTIQNQATRRDLVVVVSEHFHATREAIDELRRRQIPTLYAIDGILEWRNAWENRPDEPASPFTMRPVLSHKVACIGHSQARILASWGNQAKTELVGVPRFDRLLGRSPRSDSDSFRVLIMSAKFPGFTEQQVENATRGLSDVRDYLAKNKEIDGRRVQPVWRLTQNLADRIGVKNGLQDLTGNDLAAALEQVDAVVTTPSTAMLEGMLQGVPVCLLEYNNCPRYVPAAWEINHSADISSVIPQLISPPVNKMELQSFLLHDALQCDSPATPRLIQLIERMLQVSGIAEENNNPLRFPREPLLSVPAQQDDCQSAHKNVRSDWYPDYSDWLEQDETSLALKFADAKRELQFSNNELKQAKAELAEAHAIFDQIKSHPIAGPVVRAREGLRRWMQRRRNS